MHWAAELALRLLQERHAAQNIDSSSSGSSFWQPWIASLPERVVTPLEFTEEEVQALVLPSTIQVRCNCYNCHINNLLCKPAVGARLSCHRCGSKTTLSCVCYHCEMGCLVAARML
jgi:hypothetical protein